ncbi:polar amino acid transport system substrate-binding protein [Frankia sp. AiPs1]|uniref:glutamate ABC transporter substrate-binding protein n=1 Tax=Frankia sp. AiPa1 TaxID=573492 RepID=UPI00202AFFCA|nr:glutamate ABC transporter substrate-binding protein [Frankia sp. AiPa1]MCL9759970.1 glutamate ABC transporter substrate-binding protein [Frankia sp. AiPa1]
MTPRWWVPAVVLVAMGVLALTDPTVRSEMPAAAEPLTPPRQPALAIPTPSSRHTADCGDLTASLRPHTGQPDAAPATAALRPILDRGYLTVAVRPDTPPFASVDVDTGEFTGFEIDLAKEIGRALFGADGHVRFRAVTAAERIDVVRRGEVDLSVATVTVTCARRAQVDFSAVYYQASKNVLVRASSPYRSLADLGGRRVCAAVGTTSLQLVVDTPNHPVPYPVANVTDCLVALQQGTVEGVVNDDTVLAGMAAQDPQTRITGPKSLDVPTAIAVGRDHPELTRFVNGVLARMAADGSWVRLYAANGLTQVLGPALAPPTAHYRDR